MDFYALRVSLVAAEPQLFTNKNMSEDIYSFESAISHSVVNSPTNADNVKLYSINIMIKGHDEGVMAGIVAKAKSLHGHDSEFIEFIVDDFPPMVWIWDRQQQVILVEKKTSVLPTATAACKAFGTITNNIQLSRLGLRADIEPVLNNTENSFWEEYDKFEFVQSVLFELTPPNLFGETEKEMKKALNNTAQSTNANKITTKFENTDSKLNLKSEGLIGNMVNWCRKGGGNWLLKGRLAGREQRMGHVKSEKTAKIVVMEGGITEVTLENYNVDDIVQVIDLYRQQYHFNDKLQEDIDV